MAAGMRYLPLLLLSALSALFVCYSYYYHSSLPLPSTIPYAPTTSIICTTSNPNPNPNPYPVNFTLTIKVLAFDRLDSLTRCLGSLARADYCGDRVNLHIYVDHFTPADSEDDTDKRLENSRQILEFVDGFRWGFGDKMVHYRTGNAGLQAQWLEAWWPTSDGDFVFVVEDDLEVSSLYYKFLRGLILNYYYNASNFSPWIYGASLQRPRFVPGKHGNKLQLNSETRFFLYQLVGTWGQLLFPRPWKEFRLWYDAHKAKGIKPLLNGMATTGWYKKMGDKIWTPWFIKFIHSRGYFNIYFNYPRQIALSISHRDAGVNYRRTAGPDSSLIGESSNSLDMLEMQPLNHLKWYDFCFREVRSQSIVRSFPELGPALDSVQKGGTILIVGLFSTSEVVTRNLLCHFERLNIVNYILVGRKSSLLLDLARRGHPVIDADAFFGSVSTLRFTALPKSILELAKDIIIKTYLIKKCLESGYHSWVMDGNMLLVGNDLFSVVNDVPNDFYAGEATGLFFVRSSSSSQKIWAEFMNKAAIMLSSVGDSLYNVTSPFVYITRNLLEQKGVKVKRADEKSFGMKIDAKNVNKTSLRGTEKLVFWLSDSSMDLIPKWLQELGMWIIDSDLSCMGVFCHQP